MRNVKRRGTSAELNALRGPAGLLAFDIDTDSLRVYDGQTLGGWAFTGDAVFNMGPGPTELLAGDFNAGYFGEVSSTTLLTRDETLLGTGLSQGTPSTQEPGWLKFVFQSHILYIAKQPLVTNVSWETLYQLGLVYGIDGDGGYPSGEATNQICILQKDNAQFLCRLPKGANADPTEVTNNTSSSNTAIDELTLQSEWDQLLLAVNSVDPLGRLWDSFTSAELGMTGSNTWCQESFQTTTTNALTRGGNSPNQRYYVGKANTSTAYAWRPVLQLMQDGELLITPRELTYDYDNPAFLYQATLTPETGRYEGNTLDSARPLFTYYEDV